MLTASTLLLAALAPQGQGESIAPVAINEFSYDDTGSNNRVFVELYNSTSAPIDISGWVLQGVDGSSTTPLNASVTIPAATVLAAGGFYVIGQAANVPNVDLDVPAMNTVLETGPDGLVLQDALQSDVDAVAWEYARWSNAVPTWLEGDGLFGDILNSDSNPQSASRVFDGYDTDNNGCDFRIARWSPGTSNNTAHSSGQAYVNNFDDAVGSTTAADFNYSFVPGTTADPATLGIPASPQGGNVSTWYDPTGGGDANFFSANSGEDWVLESYVYLRGPAASFDSNDIETWGMGVRGSTDSFGEPPDINGLYAYAGATWQAGVRGVGWVQIIKQQSSGLWLLDFNDGGNDFTVLAGPIPIQTDMWVRLRLSVIGSNLVCNFGGTFGCDDGVRLTPSGITICPGSIYIQYRENVSTAGAHRPLVIDSLVIAPNKSAAVTQVGIGSPTNVGIPLIGANGVPNVGNLGFAFLGSNLIPNGASFTMITIGQASLPGTQIPGAQPGALLYMNNVGATTMFNLNSAAGTTLVPCPIPCNSALSCLQIAGQIFDIDLSIPAPIPFGTTAGLTATIGN